MAQKIFTIRLPSINVALPGYCENYTEWIPPGFAHGFVVTSEAAEFLYKTTDYWYPEHERILLWCDPTVGIQWPVDCAPILAAKDAAGKVLAEADAFA
jgi:dTDP-4-dehydrorhamnose 3,5-epimerase